MRLLHLLKSCVDSSFTRVSLSILHKFQQDRSHSPWRNSRCGENDLILADAIAYLLKIIRQQKDCMLLRLIQGE